MSSPIRIVQISDTHVFADKDKNLLGVNTEQSFQAVLELLKAQKVHPDMIIHSGDLTQDAREEGYIRLAEQLSTLDIPIYCTPGNHDDSNIMKKVYPHKQIAMQKQLITDKWQIILLDSHQHGKVEGYFEQSELDFLTSCLKKHPQHYMVIFFHHQPIKTGCEWLDAIGLTNAAEFLEVLTHYPNVIAVFFGHVHQSLEEEKNNIKYYGLPSTCIQFKKNSAQFSLEELPPGYRFIELNVDGTIKTNVHRVAHYVGTFEANAKGY